MTEPTVPRPSGPSNYRIGAWTTQAELHRLSREGSSVQVEPRLMDLLMCLASRPGEVWSRSELLDRVWSDAVVNEEALTRSISELRRILGDDTQQPAYIETIRKGGYRLVASVENLVVEPGDTRQTGTQATQPRIHRRLGLALVGLALVFVVVGIVMQRQGQNTANAPATTPLSSIPLTSYPGIEEHPALSPDGTMIAFTWGGPDDDNLDIYLKQVGRENPLRLTDHASWDAYPVWLPSGEELAYIHGDDGGVGILAVPLLGGEPRAILGPLPEIYGMAFTPDGQQLIYSMADIPDGPGQLRRRHLVTGEDGLLVAPAGDDTYLMPLMAPDGRRVAFLLKTPAGQDVIMITDLDGATPRPVPTDLGRRLEGFCWHANGEELVVSTRQGGDYALWRLNPDSGAMQWIPVHGEWMFFPHMGFDSDCLVYQHRRFEKNVWQIKRPSDPALGLSTDPVLVSTHWDCEARLDPAGERLAFNSSRSGNLEIWMSRADGSQPVQLTHLGGARVSSPCWSPDGTRLAFNAGPEGWSNVYVMDVATRQLTRITDHAAHDLFPTWSSDGHSLYCGSNRSGQWQVWRVPVDPNSSQEPSMLTAEGGVVAREDATGKFLYFTRRHEAGFWRLDLASNQVDQIYPDLPRRGHWANWDLWTEGMITMNYDENGPRIVNIDLSTSQLTVVSTVPNISVPSLTVTADGRTIMYARIENNVGDLMLIKDFH